jgi:uncharacterized phage protein (TIGR02216 family)
MRARSAKAPSQQEDAFPWRQAMAFGFGRLRLAPRDFWAMTPRELAAAVEGVVGSLPAPLDRTVLDALMARYPDGSQK